MRLWLLAVWFVPIVESYKILVYNPQFSHSHGNYMGSIADILADAGHNVTSLIPVINSKIKEGTSKSTIIRVQPSEELKIMNDKMNDGSVNMFEIRNFNPMGAFFVGRMLGSRFSKSCRNILEQPGLMERLRDEHYDVAIAENFDMCGVGIAYAVKPKAIVSGFSSAIFGQLAEEFGVPIQPSFMPSLYTSNLDVHPIVSRAWNIVGTVLTNWFFSELRADIHDVFVEKYGANFPSWKDINSNAAYSFANSEPLIDFAQPTMHKVLSIASLGANEPKPLDKQWLEVLSRKPRTVLISFGSVAESHQLEITAKRAILKTISNFPDVTFIWKYEKDDEFAKNEAAKLPNLVLSKWTPQNDLLNHNHLAAFVSHGGMGSVQETARRGVPAIFVPIFGDQPRNAAMMEHNGLGKVYDKFELHDSDKLTAVLRQILDDERYSQRAKLVSRMIANKPFSSKEILIKHIEFAAEFGPSPALRSQSIDMNFIEYHNLDILLIELVISIISLAITLKCILIVIRRFTASKTKLE